MCCSFFQKAKCKNHASGRSDELVNSFDVNHMNVFYFYLKYHDYSDSKNSRTEGLMNGILVKGYQLSGNGICTLCFYLF